MISILWIALHVTLGQAAEAPASKQAILPRVLQDAFEQRMKYKTAHFKVRREDFHDGNVSVVKNLEYQWAGDSLHYVDRGDDDGIRLVDQRTGNGYFGVRNACLPQEIVLDQKREKMWLHEGSYDNFNVNQAEHWLMYTDIRTVGLRMMEVQRTDPRQAFQLLKNDSQMRFSEQKIKAGLIRVIAVGSKHPDGSFYDFEWDIDPEKGPAITGAREWITDDQGKRKIAGECTLDLMQVDGRWWPSRAEYLSPESGDRTVIEFQSVEFDRANHPAHIDMDTLGIPIGAPILGDPVLHRQRYLGNGNLVSEPEWNKVKDQYDTSALHNWFAKMNAMGRGYVPAWWDTPSETLGLDDLPNRPDLWGAYVRRWIRKHTTNEAWVVAEPLTEAQKNAAWDILADCRKKATPIRARLDSEAAAVSSEIALLEKKSAQAKGVAPPHPIPALNNKAPSTQPDAGSDEFKTRLVSLREKLAKSKNTNEFAILFDELKHRVDAVLTEKQRDPAGGRLNLPAPPPFGPPRGKSPGRR